MSATPGNHIVNSPSDMAKKEGSSWPLTAKRLGAVLRERREKSGLTPSELALKLDLARTSIYAYESGQAWPSFPKLVELARVLRIRPDELPGLDDWDALDRDFPSAAVFDVKDDKAKPWAFAIQLAIAGFALTEAQRRAIAELMLPILRDQVGEEGISQLMVESKAIGRVVAEVLQRHPDIFGGDTSADDMKKLFGALVDELDGPQADGEG